MNEKKYKEYYKEQYLLQHIIIRQTFPIQTWGTCPVEQWKLVSVLKI